LAEFTGERVIPGEVDPDLWNEHIARYTFAARIAGGCLVLDAGCGTGYGAAELAQEARNVLGIDVSEEAIAFAREHYRRDNLRFERASCLEIPAADGSFDLVVAFEIIEHLSGWRDFLGEVRRVLAPGGRFLVSTPNKLYYTEARAQQGPNPFHKHEFEFNEFRVELEAFFPRVTLYLENHASAIVFEPAQTLGTVAAKIEQATRNAGEAHFFLAVCGLSAETEVPALAYVPRAANMLRDRERHIDALESQLRKRIARVVELQEELAQEQIKARLRIDELEESNALLVNDLQGRVSELAECVEHLHAAEHTVEERTAWAQRNEAEAAELRSQLQALWGTRWFRAGNKLGFVPKPHRGK